MDEVLSTISNQILPHWPFVVVVIILAVVGQVTSKSVFTKTRAYTKQKATAFYRFWESQSFWWWGRETLPLHPIASGILIGILWSNPEGADPSWKPIASLAYFAGAGAISLFAWSILRGILRKRGIDLALPGDDDASSTTISSHHKTTEVKEEVVEEKAVMEEEHSN